MKARYKVVACLGFFALVGSPTAIALQFPAVPNRGAPATTSGGGTRGDTASCVNTETGEISLNPLTPYYGKTVTTASANPTLYFYLPPTRATEGEVVLLDENDNELVAVGFAIPRGVGIARLTLQPKTPLVGGKSYRWSVSLVCDAQNRNRDVSIDGTLEYRPLETPIARDLESKNSIEKARFYAGRGDWLDTLDHAAKIRDTQPSAWSELLQSVGLDALVDRPLIDCCTPKP